MHRCNLALVLGVGLAILSSTAVAEPTAFRFQSTGPMTVGRGGTVLITLSDGRVLAAGGSDGTLTAIPSAEVFNPQTRTWSATAPLNSPAFDQKSVLLADGRVLLAGGTDLYQSIFYSRCDLYLPATGTFAPAASMIEARTGHCLVSLADGRVLAAGGFNASGPFNTVASLSSAEIYDPQTNSWSPTGSLNEPRPAPFATRLANGRVLVFGGSQTIEVFDPNTGAWSYHPSVVTVPFDVVVPLADGRFLLTARQTYNIFDPISGSVVTIDAPPEIGSTLHGTLLPSGRILVVGDQLNGADSYSLAATFDPATSSWDLVGQIAQYPYPARMAALPDGRVLFTGGRALVISATNNYVPESHLFEPVQGEWTSVPALPTALRGHSAVSLPDGRIVVIGGRGGDTYQSAVYALEPSATLAPLPAPRAYANAALLPNGQILVVGGFTAGDMPLTSVLAYDPVGNTWRTLPSPGASALRGASLTRLNDGRFLLACDLTFQCFDPATETWSLARPLQFERHAHSATLLTDGRVLLAGGANWSGPLQATAEIVDPISNLSTRVADLKQARAVHVAARLPDGKVMVSDGLILTSSLGTIEIYDPTTNQWEMVSQNRPQNYYGRATTLTSDGLLVAAGGLQSSNPFRPLAEVEYFDPSVLRWRSTSPLPEPKSEAALITRPDGTLLLVGGETSTKPAALRYTPRPALGTLAEVQLGTNAATVRWNGARPDDLFRIERADSLSAPWQVLLPGMRPSAGGVLEATDSLLPATSARFYRARLLP